MAKMVMIGLGKGEGADAADDEGTALAEDVISAVRDKDPEALYEALRELVLHCQGEGEEA